MVPEHPFTLTLYTARLASPNETDGTDHTGEIISFSDFGSGVATNPPAWYCYASTPYNVLWLLPGGGKVTIDLVTMVATGAQLFISGVVDPPAVVLHRGPTHFSPDGEHCCVVASNTAVKRCVTFSEC